jgi:hypothetical protein
MCDFVEVFLKTFVQRARTTEFALTNFNSRGLTDSGRFISDVSIAPVGAFND